MAAKAKAQAQATDKVTALVGPMPQVPSAKPQLVSQAEMYCLSTKTAKAIDTLQAGAKTGLGKGWRAAAVAKGNSRGVALAAIADAMAQAGAQSLTADQVLAALATVKAHLGSGSPRSYFRAFVASGYLVAA